MSQVSVDIRYIKEIYEDGVGDSLVVYGTWTHPKHGTQNVEETISGGQADAYYNAPNQNAKNNIVDGMLTGHLVSESARLDALTREDAKLDETKRTADITV